MKNIKCKSFSALILIALFFSNLCHSSEIKISKDEFQKIQEKVQNIENNIEIQRHTLQTSIEANDKHIGDFGVLVTMQGTQSTLLSILIGLIAAAAGVLSYFHTVAHAKNLAKDAAEKWFQEEAKELKQQILELKNKSNKAHDDIENIINGFKTSTKLLNEELTKELNIIMQNKHTGEKNKNEKNQPNDNVKSAIEELKTRPENSFTAEDYYIKGVDHFSEENWHGALASFKKSVEIGRLSKSDNLCRFLKALANVLERMNKYEDAIEILNEIEINYRDSKKPQIRRLVASSLVDKAVALGKIHREKEEIESYDLVFERYGNAPTVDILEILGIASYNKALIFERNKNKEKMMAAYKEIDEKYGNIDSETLKDVVGDSLLDMTSELLLQGKHEEEDLIFKKIHDRYDSDPLMKRFMARANNYRAFSHIIRAKKNWIDKDLSLQQLNSALEFTQTALNKEPDNDNTLYILGNIGYINFLMGSMAKARDNTKKCLNEGGKRMLDIQRDDAMTHRIEPEDTNYEELLNEIWNEFRAS